LQNYEKVPNYVSCIMCHKKQQGSENQSWKRDKVVCVGVNLCLRCFDTE